MVKGQEHLFYEKLRELRREEKAQGRSCKCLLMPEGRVQRWSQALFSGAQCQDKRQQAQTGTQKVPSKHQEELTSCEGDGTPVQVALRGLAALSLKDVENHLDMVLGNLV